MCALMKRLYSTVCGVLLLNRIRFETKLGVVTQV